MQGGGPGARRMPFENAGTGASETGVRVRLFHDFVSVLLNAPSWGAAPRRLHDAWRKTHRGSTVRASALVAEFGLLVGYLK
jgi:hypothetical protein